MLRINLNATDIANLVQDKKKIQTLEELDKEILCAIRSYVGQQSIHLIHSLKSELETQLQTSELDEFSAFAISLRQIIAMSKLSPVSREYLNVTARMLQSSSDKYQSVLPLSHTFNHPDYEQYHSSHEAFKHFLTHKALPEEYQRLEYHLTLLEMQLPHAIQKISIDTTNLSLVINETARTSSPTLTVPSFIHMQRVEFSALHPVSLHVCENSSVAFVDAHTGSSFRFEDKSAEMSFREKNKKYFPSLTHPFFNR